MKNKKTVITIISIVAVLLVIIGVTYAYWLVTRTQTNENIISSGCLDISLTGEKNDITLTDQFPLSDEDGMKLVPYEFTVTNNCTTSVDYQVNLESIGDSANAIKASAIKVALNDEIKLLTAGGNTEPTLSGAYESNMILYGTLAGKSDETTDDKVTYELRIWIDADASISEQNKTFTSKISVTIGQGITNPYKEGTLAYSILSNYGGMNSITEISAKWEESAPQAYSQTISTNNKYWWGTEYDFNEGTGYFTVSGDVVYASIAECKATSGLCGKYSTLLSQNVIPSYRHIYVVSDLNNLSSMQRITSSNPFFAGTNETSINKTEDDYGTSYYFWGNPDNNYVKFGTYKEPLKVYRGYYSSSSSSYKEYESLEACNSATSYNVNCSEYIYANAGTPMYWRIVRINGDGTIRMIYDGTSPVANGVAHAATIGSYIYNSDINVGYTYEVDGNNKDSNVKAVLDNWYDKNLKYDYGKYIADTIFCNDKEIIKELSDSLSYGADKRVSDELNPQLTCRREIDRYTVNGNIGNGLLKYPVGLITADEVLMSGPSLSDNYFYAGHSYLYDGIQSWTMSPVATWNSHNNSLVWTIASNGKASETYTFVNGSYGVRPVINLKADVKFTGNGRIDTNTPYEIVMN